MNQIYPEKLYARWCLVLLIVALVGLSWWQIVDVWSRDLLDDLLKQAASVYGVARVVNGTLKLLQSVQLSVPVVGGASIAPLEIFAPWNDLIHRFSTLMELSIGSLFIQRLLIEIVSTQVYQVLFTLFAAGACLSIFRSQFPGAAWWIKGCIVLGFIRYAMLIVVMLNGAIDHTFLHHRTANDLQSMKQLTTVIEDSVETDNSQLRKELQQRLINAEAQRDVTKAQYQAALDPEQKKQFEMMLQHQNQDIAHLRAELTIPPMQLMKSIATSGKQLWANISQQLDDNIEKILRLMAIFILQAMLLPLFFLWGLKQVLHYMLRHSALSKKN